MIEVLTKHRSAEGTQRHVLFAVFVAASIIGTLRICSALVFYSFRNDSSSHILLIPFISLFLIYSMKGEIFVETQTSSGLGGALIALGIATLWLVRHHSLTDEGRLFLSSASLSIVLIWIGAFLLFYGRRATRAALFPLLFLLLIVPLPDAILGPVIHLLQEGSTETALLIFRAAGVPVFQRGFVLSLPTVSIEVASECSSIRSSIALFITCLLAAHFSLRTRWKALLFVALAVPFSVIKNGIRIATLALLSIYVDPRFLTGSLHRDGGFVFFFLALLMLWPVLRSLRRSEVDKRNNKLRSLDKCRTECAGG